MTSDQPCEILDRRGGSLELEFSMIRRLHAVAIETEPDLAEGNLNSTRIWGSELPDLDAQFLRQLWEEVESLQVKCGVD
jgi:hypothetical protein